jgi:dynein heavy chain
LHILKRLRQNQHLFSRLTEEASVTWSRVQKFFALSKQLSESIDDYVFISSELERLTSSPQKLHTSFLLANADQEGRRLDFFTKKNEFVFKSFWPKPSVAYTWKEVRFICMKVSEELSLVPPYVMNETKCMTLEEFDTLFVTHLAEMHTYLRQIWVHEVLSTLKTGLSKVGKGWYSMSVSSHEVYSVSRLKSFVTAVRFLMQDSLVSLLSRSIEQFLRIMSNKTRAPLLHLGLTFRSGEIQYDVHWIKIFEIVSSSLDRMISAIEFIPDIESQLLSSLYWAANPVLLTLSRDEHFIVDAKNVLSEILKGQELLLQSYKGAYSISHLRFLCIDVPKWIAEYDAMGKPVEDMEVDMLTLGKEWELLDKSLISAQIDCFFVSCESLRKELKKDLPKQILELLARRTVKEALNLSIVFGKMQNRCRERPSKPEELGELREYLHSVPNQIESLRVQIDSLSKDFDLLEKYRYELSNEDFKSKWAAYSWPNNIDRSLQNAQESLAIDEQNFIKFLQVDQDVFKERVGHISIMISELPKLCDLKKITEINAEVSRVDSELKDALSMASLYNSREKLFSIPSTSYEELVTLSKDFEPYKNLWTNAADWIRYKALWLHGKFLDLNAEEVEKSLTSMWRAMIKAGKTFKNMPACQQVASQLKEEMEDFKPALPLIQALRNPGMRERHWEKLSREISIDASPKEGTMLSEILKMRLSDHMETITKISEEAGKEFSIENALEKMESEWRNVQLEISPYRDSGTFILKISEDNSRLLEDHIVMTQSISFSPYKKPFSERITLWESKLHVMQDVLEEWTACQRQWLYLEPVFSSSDINKQLPTESKRFANVDKVWRKVMLSAYSKPAILEVCTDSKLLETFRESNKLLELVSKGLTAYLESKRVSFPRFFFLSDDELLQILSQARDPLAVQPHLRKAFENMNKLEFYSDGKLSAMVSADGESVSFVNPFSPTGNVEEWLLCLEMEMKATLRGLLKEAIRDHTKRPREEWVLRWPGQLVIAASQSFFTQDVSNAIAAGELQKMHTKQLSSLEGLVALVRGNLTEVARLSIGALIVIDVHARDVIRSLLEAKINDVNDFEWISQLRYYWEENQSDLSIRIVNSNFKYGYEYLGNNGRLVITPLTDRCYLTLTGAMHLGMGGAPAGPAGTGKTETTKDLAKALAKQCVVLYVPCTL